MFERWQGCAPVWGAAGHLLCCRALALCDVHGMCSVVHRQVPMGLDVTRAASLHDVVFWAGKGKGHRVCAKTGGTGRGPGRQVLPGGVIFLRPTTSHITALCTLADATLPNETPASSP